MRTIVTTQQNNGISYPDSTNGAYSPSGKTGYGNNDNKYQGNTVQARRLDGEAFLGSDGHPLEELHLFGGKPILKFSTSPNINTCAGNHWAAGSRRGSEQGGPYLQLESHHLSYCYIS